MADWKTVRFDPTYEEPLDAEIVPLLDAMNAAGFVTTASCCGHGAQWPLVCFEDNDTARIERMARYVLASEKAAGDYQPSFSVFDRETRLAGHAWALRIHLNDVYHDTPPATTLALAVGAMGRVAKLIAEWSAAMPSDPPAPAYRDREGAPLDFAKMQGDALYAFVWTERVGESFASTDIATVTHDGVVTVHVAPTVEQMAEIIRSAWETSKALTAALQRTKDLEAQVAILTSDTRPLDTLDQGLLSYYRTFAQAVEAKNVALERENVELNVRLGAHGE